MSIRIGRMFYALSALLLSSSSQAFSQNAQGHRPSEHAPKFVIDCRVPLSCSCDKHSYYAYAPAAVGSDKSTTLFYCSEGANGAWDYIRSSSSRDGGETWSEPQIKVMARGNKVPGKSDYAACDPSIVRYQGPKDDRPFFYLFYGSAETSPGGNDQTTIQVARSESMNGPFETLLRNGTWRESTWKVGEAPPSGIPRVLVHAHYDVKGYGAGQPTVVATKDKDGEPVLKMWYTDTSNYKSNHALIFAMESKDPGHWPVPENWPQPEPAEGRPQYDPNKEVDGNPALAPVETNVYQSTVDVKFDNSGNSFLLFYMDGQKQIYCRTSRNGINWTEPVIPNGISPSQMFFDGPAVLGNVRGHMESPDNISIFIGGGWNSKKQKSSPAFNTPDPSGIYRVNNFHP